MINQKYINYIYFSDYTAKHKNIVYQWDNTCLTVAFAKTFFTGRRINDIYIFFSDHFLSEAEVNSKKTKQEGFYLMLTPKRSEFILPYCSKKVCILCKPTYKREKKITDIFTAHNQGLDSQVTCSD